MYAIRSYYVILHTLNRNIPIASSMGAGGKIDPTKVTITDISKTSTCALARSVRKRFVITSYSIHYTKLYESDGWTTRTTDGMMSAHYEHSVAIRKGKADVLSTFKYIEDVLGTNAI